MLINYELSCIVFFSSAKRNVSDGNEITKKKKNRKKQRKETPTPSEHFAPIFLDVLPSPGEDTSITKIIMTERQ